MNASWLAYSTTAMLLLATADFMLGALNKKLNPPVSTFTLNLVAYAYMALISVGLYIASRESTGSSDTFLGNIRSGMGKIQKGEAATWVLVPLVAMGYLAGNRFLWRTYKTAPTIGLAEAAGSLSSGVVLILTVLLFKVKYKIVNVVGIVMSILGLEMLSGRLSSSKL